MALDKNIGFDRHVKLVWMDHVASLVLEGESGRPLRAHIDDLLKEEVVGTASRQKTAGVLYRAWQRPQEHAPDLFSAAVTLFRSVEPAERVWIHFGLTTIAFPFFRDGVRIIGQEVRRRDTVVESQVLRRISEERGNLGTLEGAVRRIFSALRDWKLLTPDQNTAAAYRPCNPLQRTSHADLQLWLLACGLRMHQAQEVPTADLLRLAEFFPFQFDVRSDALRTAPWFEVNRQGAGFDMVRTHENVANCRLTTWD